MRALALAALAAATGCSNLLGLDDPQLADAGGGPDATDAPIDGPDIDAPSNTVTGRSYYRTTTVAAGVTEVPLDMTAAVIQALIPDPGQPSGYRVANGTGLADGTFTINDVPDGQTYLLKIGRAYYHTSDHTIDQHFEIPSRYQPATSTGATTVAFNVDSMQPFVNGPAGTSDSLDVYSFAAGYQGFHQVAHNASTLVEPYDWRNGFGIAFPGSPLPDASLGDDLHVFHSRNTEESVAFGRKISVQRLVDWFDAGAVTVTDNTSTPVAGAFTPATQNRTLTVNYQRGAFDSAYPPAYDVNASLTVYAHPNPGGNDFSFGVPLLSLSFFDWSRSTSLQVSHTAPYSDPLPAGWSRMLAESYVAFRYVRLPGTTLPRGIFGGTDRLRDLPPGTPVLTPVLQPPGMVRVAGQDAVAGGRVAFDGIAPITLTWAPVAAARVYSITVTRLFANGNATRSQVAATLTTAATSIAIPAEVFTGGEFFTFTVASVATPADYDNGDVVLNGKPYSFARVASGMFRLSSLCGNSNLDTGEQCDTGNASATCDVDCTPVQCGDGTVNAAANEQCDHIRDTLGCDSDCTLPMCGDGHVNAELEDCDDGNTSDEGNGCSTECKFNNSCGDALLQPLAESCDDGGDSMMCNANCTPHQCGDGIFNTVAEQCDLGFANDQPGSGCDSNCMLTP